MLVFLHILTSRHLLYRPRFMLGFGFLVRRNEEKDDKVRNEWLRVHNGREGDAL
jgi:hypothetical protein